MTFIAVVSWGDWRRNGHPSALRVVEATLGVHFKQACGLFQLCDADDWSQGRRSTSDSSSESSACVNAWISPRHSTVYRAFLMSANTRWRINSLTWAFYKLIGMDSPNMLAADWQLLTWLWMARVDRGLEEHFWRDTVTALKIWNHAHLTSAIGQSSTAMLSWACQPMTICLFVILYQFSKIVGIQLEVEDL